MSSNKDNSTSAQVVIPCKDLTAETNFFTEIGFRLDNIFPSDDPAAAIMSGHGLNIRLDKNAKGASVTLHILSDSPEKINGAQNEFTAPGGTIIKVLPKTFALDVPPTQHKFEVRRLRDNDPWVIGRAGMLYRDLIPDRLGGSIIASHIRIPNGGPVPDMVHYHTIGFQLIFCYSGWVKLVYEDQGPPFILHAGDCVTQPPEIRHRVLEASDNLEVIEIGVPASHMTTIDHEMGLPTKNYLPQKEFKGQTFCHHKAKDAVWKNWRVPGFTARDTGINAATKGVASVIVARAASDNVAALHITHTADILFTFVMKGHLELAVEGQETQNLMNGDAFVISPNIKYNFSNCSSDLELLEVALPGV